MIRFADSTMIPALRGIWQEAFGDTSAYTDFFYANRFTGDNTLVWIADGAPVAMMTLLPAKIQTADGFYPAQYVYGVATKKQYRGQGLSSALIRHANDLADQRNEALVLVPSSERLFDFYEKNGYRTAFYLKQLVIPAEEGKPKLPDQYTVADISAHQYKTLRDERFSQPGYLCWDEASLDYCLRENAFTGGQCVKISFPSQGTEYALMYYISNKTMFVKETTLDEESILPILSDFAHRMGCDHIHARLPEWFDMPLARKPFGMLYAKNPLQASFPYLNLVLD